MVKSTERKHKLFIRLLHRAPLTLKIQSLATLRTVLFCSIYFFLMNDLCLVQSFMCTQALRNESLLVVSSIGWFFDVQYGLECGHNDYYYFILVYYFGGCSSSINKCSINKHKDIETIILDPINIFTPHPNRQLCQRAQRSKHKLCFDWKRIKAHWLTEWSYEFIHILFII